MMSKLDLSAPEYYINRELSMLQFNLRVLALAQDKDIPLLERLRFLFICSSNLDEFFEIRVAGVKERIALGSAQPDKDGLTAEQAYAAISGSTHALVAQIYDVFNEQLIPELHKQHIHFLEQSRWTENISTWVKRYFRNEILPILSPVGLDLAHPFPRIVNKSLNFIVSLEGKDAFGRDSGLAIVHAPRALARVLKVPEEFAPRRGDYFVLLTSMIKAHTKDLFPGMTVTGCYQFRLTRNSDLFVEEEEVEDLALALQSELFSRHYGHAVRLEIAADCPKDLAHFLLRQHHLEENDMYYCQGPVNLSRYMAVLDLIARDDLCYPSFIPARPTRLKDKRNLYAAIQKEDILLHHPYQAFSLVVDFIRVAALDPNVLAIKQTLYRTRPESAMVQALIEAARAGKEVTAIIELRARFDEASNIALANSLQEAGALVVYGIVGFKTHAKMTLVVRREGDELRRYVHLGTGNYHESTAKQYTDFGLLSHNEELTKDVQKVFQQLTGMGKMYKLKKLLHSPFNLHDTLLELIQFETTQAKKHKKAHIIIKVNGLTDSSIIEALYKASQAGVTIQLLVRGICCLRPGIKGVSENISVYSIVGRFLEHSRIYYFHHAGDRKLYCASADMMERNLYHRVELCFPIEDPVLADRVFNEGLANYLNEDIHKWQLNSDGSYDRHCSKKNEPHSAQQFLLEKLSQP